MMPGEEVDDQILEDVRNDPWFLLLEKCEQARFRGDYREAVKLANKVIAMHPAQPYGYLSLGFSYSDSGDITNAVPHYLKAIELSDAGTEVWAKATFSVYELISRKECVVPKPAWVSDPEQLKRVANLAVAALPNNAGALQMRSLAYAQNYASVSADDLRQALRDRRRIVDMMRDMFEEGSAPHRRESERARIIEARLRARIAADLASAAM